MPHRNGTWEHKWFVNYQINCSDIESTLETFVDEDAAWQFYKLMKERHITQYGEMYVFVPREKKNGVL